MLIRATEGEGDRAHRRPSRGAAPGCPAVVSRSRATRSLRRRGLWNSHQPSVITYFIYSSFLQVDPLTYHNQSIYYLQLFLHCRRHEALNPCPACCRRLGLPRRATRVVRAAVGCASAGRWAGRLGIVGRVIIRQRRYFSHISTL